MKKHRSDSLLVWLLQTGEPLHSDDASARPMRAMNLTDSLLRAGHRVVLWSSSFNHQQGRHRVGATHAGRLIAGLELRLIHSRGYRRHIGLGRLVDHAQLAVNLKKMLRRQRVLPDVAFVGYPPVEAAAVLARWLSDRGVPSLLDVKDQWPSLYLNALPAVLRPLGHVALWPYYRLAKRAMRDATAIISMADSFLDWALDFSGRPRTPLDGVFPLTSPTGQVSESELQVARRWWDERGITAGGPTRMCFVGSHMSVFDFGPVQEAARLAATAGPQCEFVVCGDGGSSAALHSMMAGLPGVCFPGWVDRPKIEALAERCHAALAPYLNIANFTTNLPNKVIDALCLGLPILSPLQGEVARLICDHGVGLRYGTDTGLTLHDCIVTLTEDPSLRAGMSARARALHAQRFSFETVYGGLVRRLEALASEHRYARDARYAL